MPTITIATAGAAVRTVQRVKNCQGVAIYESEPLRNQVLQPDPASCSLLNGALVISSKQPQTDPRQNLAPRFLPHSDYTHLCSKLLGFNKRKQHRNRYKPSPIGLFSRPREANTVFSGEGSLRKAHGGGTSQMTGVHGIQRTIIQRIRAFRDGDACLFHK